MAIELVEIIQFLEDFNAAKDVLRNLFEDEPNPIVFQMNPCRSCLKTTLTFDQDEMKFYNRSERKDKDVIGFSFKTTDIWKVTFKDEVIDIEKTKRYSDFIKGKTEMFYMSICHGQIIEESAYKGLVDLDYRVSTLPKMKAVEFPLAEQISVLQELKDILANASPEVGIAMSQYQKQYHQNVNQFFSVVRTKSNETSSSPTPVAIDNLILGYAGNIR